MRELNLIFKHFGDLEEAISILNQRAFVYKGKLDSHASHKEYRKNNMCFELFRSKFYKGLAGDQKVVYTDTDEEIKSYWDTMWNELKEEKSFDTYLHEFIPPSSQAENIFPSYNEFQEIVKELPS